MLMRSEKLQDKVSSSELCFWISVKPLIPSVTIILEQLKRYGVLETEHDLFKDNLFMRSQQVEIGNQKSKSYSIVTGVPQGSILGPLLFLVFFNDFPDILKFSKSIQYSDDTVVYVTGKTSAYINKNSNDEVDSLYQYCYDNEYWFWTLRRENWKYTVWNTKTTCATRWTTEHWNKWTHCSPYNTIHIYFGNHLDSKLNLISNFEKKYKKMSGRLTLLSEMRQYLNFQLSRSMKWWLFILSCINPIKET